MNASTGFTSLLWFVAIIAIIPFALKWLKRTPLGGSTSQGLMRSIAALPISQTQRIVTIEVGTGEHRRWLVLGVTAQSITTLHTMEPQDDATITPSAQQAPPFAQLMSKFRRHDGAGDGR